MTSSRRHLVWACVLTLALAACATPANKPAAAPPQGLFVCEHGNVKSLMAASYFNQLARQRGLPFRALSRGSAPDSDSVPPKIISGLDGEGFDVREFHPVAVSAADAAASSQVVTIGVTLSTDLTGKVPVEQWNDVPPASVDYAAASASLKEHVRVLLDRMAAPR